MNTSRKKSLEDLNNEVLDLDITITDLIGRLESAKDDFDFDKMVTQLSYLMVRLEKLKEVIGIEEEQQEEVEYNPEDLDELYN